jgi:hypothetical protein
MDQPTVWQALGIAPTREIGEIRRAYAGRLKECHPEENPEGFQRIRTAYEAALRISRGAADAVGSVPPTPIKEAVAQGPASALTSGAIIDPCVTNVLSLSCNPEVKRDASFRYSAGT